MRKLTIGGNGHAPGSPRAGEWIMAAAISAAVHAGIFLLACWKVSNSMGWMFGR